MNNSSRHAHTTCTQTTRNISRRRCSHVSTHGCLTFQAHYRRRLQYEVDVSYYMFITSNCSHQTPLQTLTAFKNCPITPRTRTNRLPTSTFFLPVPWQHNVYYSKATNIQTLGHVHGAHLPNTSHVQTKRTSI
jgi:hypothetical protein